MPLLRFVKVMAQAIAGPRRPGVEGFTTRFLVWPVDVHARRMAHGTFHQLTDLGRFALIAATGLLPPLLRNGWSPLVRVTHMEVYRGLKLFQRVTLTTRIAAWDDKWFYVEHRFTRNGETVALALVKSLFRGPGGNVAPRDVMVAAGVDATSPPIPPEVLRAFGPPESTPLP